MKVSYNSILTKQHYQKQTKSEGFASFLPNTPNINLIDQTTIPKNDFVSSSSIDSLYQAKFTSKSKQKLCRKFKRDKSMFAHFEIKFYLWAKIKANL